MDSRALEHFHDSLCPALIEDGVCLCHLRVIKDLEGRVDLLRGLLRKCRDEIRNKIRLEDRDAVLYDEVSRVLGELAGSGR